MARTRPPNNLKHLHPSNYIISNAPTPTQGIFALISCSFLVPKFADFYVYLLCEYKSTILIRSRRRSTRPSHQHRLNAFFKAKFPLKVWRMLPGCHLHLTVHCCLSIIFRSLVFVSLKHSFYLHFYCKKKVDNHGQDATAKHKAQSQTPSSVELHHDQETTERNKAESSSSSIVAGGSVAANSVAKSSSAPSPTQGIFALISCSFSRPKIC